MQDRDAGSGHSTRCVQKVADRIRSTTADRKLVFVLLVVASRPQNWPLGLLSR